MLRSWSRVLSVVLCGCILKGQALAGALSLHGDIKYKDGFTHLDYVNPNAPKGGSLVYESLGTFETLNPYQLKGVSADGLVQYVFQTLADSSLDEPFSKYPTLAESFTVAADQLSMTIKLRANAKFADGHPVRAEDVVFSYHTLISDKADVNYRFYWEDIKEVKAVDELTVLMSFKRVNAELPLIATELPILPKHFYGKGDFARDFTDKALGSGPYMVKESRRDDRVVLQRNPEFWGKDHPMFKGRYNFDTITYRYYKDEIAALEAFKKGDFDLYIGNHSKIWATELVGERFDTLKWIKKASFTHENNQGTQGFVFNLRRPIFSDVRVRQAIALAFDFEWSNKNLFYGLYRENRSFFENSPFRAQGQPSAEELQVLAPFKAQLAPQVFSEEMGWLGKGKDFKARMRQALELLGQAGYVLKDGVATGPHGKLEFRFLVASPTFNRILEPYFQNLKKLGVIVTLEQKEESVFVKRVQARDFDMMVHTYAQSQSPGNEQREFWGTAAADVGESRNYSGLKNQGIDGLIDRLVTVKSRAELELVTRCLDRALYHEHILVHNWHSPVHKLAMWDKFDLPKVLPRFYGLNQLVELMWYDQAKAKKLEQARAENKPLL